VLPRAGWKAVGVDGVRKAEYGKPLESNLKELIVRMKRMGYRLGYRLGPVRQVLIPRGTRPVRYVRCGSVTLSTNWCRE